MTHSAPSYLLAVHMRLSRLCADTYVRDFPSPQGSTPA